MLLDLNQHSHFDPDEHSSSVVGIAADVGQHDSGLHRHKKGQLLYIASGCIRFTFEDEVSILPPTKAAWLPAGTLHRAQMNGVVAYRSLYFEPTQHPCPQQLKIIDVNDLLKALINTIALWPWEQAVAADDPYLALFWQEFAQAQVQQLGLPLPHDRRLRGFCQQLIATNEPMPELQILANRVGASSKTISRLFKAQTGLSYQQWKQQWRLQRALEDLSGGISVAETAHRLGFSSDSAFIAFYKQHLGQTPLNSIRNHR